MTKVLAKMPCPKCRACGNDNTGDNFVEFEDGFYCFACRHKEDKNKRPSQHFIEGLSKGIKDRGISQNITDFMNYQLGRYTGPWINGQYLTNEKVQIENYYDEFNNLIKQKLRRVAVKEFMWLGKGDTGLYGQWKWSPNENTFVTIVEGAVDQLSVLEAQGTRFPVVSITKGAAGAFNELKQDKIFEWLSGFKYVVLALDNDEAGRKATEECLTLFEPNKVRIATWPSKDANDILLSDKNAIKNTLFSAKSTRPDGIVTFEDLEEDIFEEEVRGLNWPWPGLNDITYGIRPEEVITIMAAPSIGKSEVVSETILNLIKEHNTNVGLMSFEQSPKRTFKRMIGKILNKRIHVPNTEYDKDQAKHIGKDILNQRLFCYKRSGRVDWEDVRGKIVYFAKALNCAMVVIDNLSSIASKFDQDERKGIDRAMLELQDLATTLNISVVLICHVSRPDKNRKALEEGGRVRLTDARGSNGIPQHSSYVIGLERNTQAEDEDERKITTLRILKDREYGTGTGQTIHLIYTDEGKLEEIKP